MKIFFQSEAECNYFKHLISYQNLFFTEIKHRRKGHELFIANIPVHIAINSFIKVYFVFRLSEKIKEIARNTYFYTKQTDIERITEWTYFLLQETTFLQEQFNKKSLFNYLYDILHNQFEKMSISKEVYYDTFIIFQLKQFHEQLRDIIGYAIDEMKREEEYQYYIHTIRQYINLRKPKHSAIHILQRKPFQFYNQLGEKLSDLELTNLMKKEPLYLVGLDERERNLAPIITLLPEIIYIYGNNANEPKTVTLLNIFQERAKLLPESSFPFQ